MVKNLSIDAWTTYRLKASYGWKRARPAFGIFQIQSDASSLTLLFSGVFSKHRS